MNGLEERIEVRNEVLVTAPDAPEAMEFHVRSSYLGSSLLNPEGRPSDLVRVPTRSFAEVCAELQPNVLIMDIEGGELELLRHMDLSGFRGVVLEFHPEAYGIGGMREIVAVSTVWHWSRAFCSPMIFSKSRFQRPNELM